MHHSVTKRVPGYNEVKHYLKTKSTVVTECNRNVSVKQITYICAAHCYVSCLHGKAANELFCKIVVERFYL